MRRIPLAALVAALTQPACVVVGGYSDEGGWYFWPGSLVLTALLVLLFLFLRRRR